MVFEVIGLIVLANIVDLVMHLSCFKKMVIEAKFLFILTSMDGRGKRLESCSWGHSLVLGLLLLLPNDVTLSLRSSFFFFSKKIRISKLMGFFYCSCRQG